jgi:retron-type reverse transcriptase
MTVADLAGYVKQYWPTLKARLLAGEYHPQAVRAVEIPKPQGGTRQLGIPSVVDRLIQQALQQQLTPLRPTVSDYSYGFRPGRSAHQAVEWPAPMWRRGIAGAWNSIWRSSLIGSTTTS